ncbi:MAG: TauD/TfdA family dioxygenase [Acidiferrobacterales bacterium]|nr:TauD/TfdA family dioxygenase [Acidiferrobacterales bacterium]
MEASHIARERIEPENRVRDIRSDENKVTIEWGDGHQSEFHTVWLRDNCSCEDCGDHSGGHRFFELNMLPERLANETTAEEGFIKICWEEDGHITLFDSAWLRNHCYSDQERNHRRQKPILWDASFINHLPSVTYASALQSDSQLLRVYDAVRTYGICLLKEVPKTPEATEEIASLLSFVRETHYGRVFEIISTPNPEVIANAPVPLRPHTDENFREPPPGIMIFHSIKASEDGGGKSVMTDGFKLAEDFKQQYPDEYALLASVPIPHRRFIEKVGLRAEAPVIGLDYFGNICEFRLNERTMGPIDLPHALIEPVYRALAKIFSLSYDSQYHLSYLLKDGEALVFDNARVLHARTGFNGNRHVRLTHVGSDEFYSRWRRLRYKLHGDINLI